MAHIIGKIQTYLGRLAASQWASGTIIVYTVLWIAFDRESLNWHGVATLATWGMTAMIQRAEHRDTQAIHAKLDELLKAEDGARDELSQIDEKEPEEIERLREREQK
jgi:low affinity Fe/Cu permease